VRIDSKVLVDNLADALNTIDLAVASALEVKTARLHWNRRAARTLGFFFRG